MTFRYVVLGTTIRSSLGSDHATTYRALLRAVAERGHDVVFLERDQPEIAATKDVDELGWGALHVYGSLPELFDRHARAIREADLVIIGSGVPEGSAVARWAFDLAPHRVAFYDLDAPATLLELETSGCSYLAPELVSRFSLYLSPAGGAIVDLLRRTYDAPWVRPLLPCFDHRVHAPEPAAVLWDVGHLGTYGEDRAAVDSLLVGSARQWTSGRFVVADEATSLDPVWPSNLDRRGHLTVAEHRAFYGAQRFTLAVGRTARSAGCWAPSARLFEAAACGASVVTEPWPGLEDLLLPGTEIFLARTCADLVRLAREVPEPERRAVGRAARARVLAEHTAADRAELLERYTRELLERRSRRPRLSLSDISTRRDGGDP